MIEAKHLLVDTNVWLDYYLQEGAFDEAKRLVELAEAGKIDLRADDGKGRVLYFASASSPAECEWD